MGYQVLARKWRPGKFSELVGQEHVVRAISNALDNNRLHHAYLFTGTRGVGKTTIARIFSRSLNCEEGMSSNPCGVCPACLDIEKGSYVDLIEIDAASRTKVEDTREILDNVQYRPTRGEYKVYLIDEVHMLSKHSFNALLKTLEEPPPHIKFLLATTDPQKLPITILSRCLQFNLKALTREQIGGQLSHVLKAENIAFQEKAIELLARSAHGSMRDALSLTDQAIAQGNGQVMSDVVSEMLGLIDADQITNLVKAILEKDKMRVLEISSELALMGTDFKTALAELMSVFHQVALTQFVPEACKLETSQARQVYAWARAVSPESVQLYYQIALQGRKDIEWAQDLKVGFEMALMRMMAFTPEAIKTDISALQAAGKQANETHSQQFSSPPESLLKNTEHQTEQAASPQKKNESEPVPVKETAEKFEHESEPQALAETQVAKDSIIEAVSAAAQVPLGNEQAEAPNSGPSSSESQQQPDSEPLAQLSEPHTADTVNQSLSNEMLSLMQEADEMRSEQQINDAQPVDSEKSQGSITGSISGSAQPVFQQVPEESQAPLTTAEEPQLTTEEPQLTGEEPQLTAEESQPTAEEPHPIAGQPQPGVDDMREGDAVFQQDYSQYQAAQDYSDYEMMQQSHEMPAQMDDFHAASPDNYSNSFVPAQDTNIQETEHKESDNGANTASLLSLMQTLNQSAAEDNKTAANKSSDINDVKPEEAAKVQEAKVSEAEQNDSEQVIAEAKTPAPVLNAPAAPAPLQSSTFNYSDDLYQTGNSQSETVNQIARENLQETNQQASADDEAFFSAQNFLNQQDVSAQSHQDIELQPHQDISQQPHQDISQQPHQDISQQPDIEPQPVQNANSPGDGGWQSDTQANTLMQEQAFPPAKQHYSQNNNFVPQESDFASEDNSFPPQESDFSYGQDASMNSQGPQTAPQQEDLNAYSQMPASQENSYQVNARAQPIPEEEYLATDTTMSVDFEIPFAVDGKKVTKASQLDTWSQLIERASLGGLTKQLALNSNYFKNGENIKLVVSETQTHLLSENTIRTIEESISGAIQQPIKVDANIGEVIDTPAAVQKAINTMRQKHAVKTINQDSAVTDICQSFSGTVLQDTIKPR